MSRDITGPLTGARGSESLGPRETAILSATGDAICGLDGAGEITFLNPALLRLMGREGEPALGARLHDLVHRDADGTERHPPQECPLTTTSPGGGWSRDPAFARRDGSQIVVGYRLVAAPPGPADSDRPGSVLALRELGGPPAATVSRSASLDGTRSLGEPAGQLAQVAERERLRIAGAVHDDLVQALDAVALRLSNAGELLPGDRERDVFIDAEIDVRGVAERLRRLMFELMPPLEGRDLREAVCTYCSVLFAQSPLRWEVVGEVGATVTDAHVVAYRLIQEGLRNALAHSGGTRVEVRLEETGGELRVRVSDDGRGLDDGEAPPTHAGLRLIRRRAEASGGYAEFGTGLDDRGTALAVRLPVSETAQR